MCVTHARDGLGLTIFADELTMLNMKLKITFKMPEREKAAAGSGLRELRLSDLRVGETAIISEIAAHEDDRHRMNVLGLSEGAEITFARTAPGGEPAIYQVEGTSLALRRDAAGQVIVSRL